MSYNDWSLSPKKLIRAFPNLPTSLLRFLPYAILLLGFLGFLDATYLTVLHYKNAIPPCTIHGCEVVLSSRFATVFGLPIALFGAAYYAAVIVLAGLLLNAGSTSSRHSGETRSVDSRIKERSWTVPRFSRKRAPFGPLQDDKKWSPAIINLLLALTGTGLVVGVFLIFLQAFVLHAFCQYCLASELIDFLLFDCAWWMWRKSE